MNDVVCLGSKHSLYVVLAITHDKSISISSLSRRRHLLDLETLHHRDGEELARLILVVEDYTDRSQYDTGDRNK